MKINHVNTKSQNRTDRINARLETLPILSLEAKPCNAHGFGSVMNYIS